MCACVRLKQISIVSMIAIDYSEQYIRTKQLKNENNFDSWQFYIAESKTEKSVTSEAPKDR